MGMSHHGDGEPESFCHLWPGLIQELQPQKDITYNLPSFTVLAVLVGLAHGRSYLLTWIPNPGPCAAAAARYVPLAPSGAGSLSHQRDECSGEEPPLGLWAHKQPTKLGL